MKKTNDSPTKGFIFILLSLLLVMQVLWGCCLKAAREPSQGGLLSKNEREVLADELHTKGLILDAEGKLEEAIDAWLKEIELSPKRARPYNNIGIAYRRLRNLDSAKAFHEKAIVTDPAFGHSYYSLGLVYYDWKEDETAKKLFLEAIKRDYFSADVYYSLGQAHRNLGEYEEALTAYEKTVKLYYSYPCAHYRLGECYRLKGKQDLARLEFKREINVNASCKRLCQIELQEIEVELDPSNPDKLFALGMLYRDSAGKEAREKAMTAFSKVVDLNSAYPDVHFQLGHLHQLNGDLIGAEEEYKKEIQINPDHVEAREALGGLEIRRKE